MYFILLNVSELRLLIPEDICSVRIDVRLSRWLPLEDGFVNWLMLVKYQSSLSADRNKPVQDAKCFLIKRSCEALGRMRCLKWSAGPDEWLSQLHLQGHTLYGFFWMRVTLHPSQFPFPWRFAVISLVFLLFWPAIHRFSDSWTVAMTLLWELWNSLTEGLGFKQMSHHISVILRQ